MERHLKERIVGATVIVALGIIIIPWLLDGPAQSPRPVEQTLELPPVESPGRTYTIPLDPAAGPPVQVSNGNGAQPTPARPGAGAVQRPPAEEPPALQPTPAPSPQRDTRAEQPPQPAPRPAPPPVEQPTPQPAPATRPPAVTSPAPAAPAQRAPEGWAVQVGSFSQADNAQALQRRLGGEGFEAYVSRVATDAGTMHRVRVGPVGEREAADRLLARVRAAGHTGARVVRAED